jgi:argininosuccinate lyase
MQDKSQQDKVWSGRFNEPVSELVKRYTASVDFDKRLAAVDIQGSLAHSKMLGAKASSAKQMWLRSPQV